MAKILIVEDEKHIAEGLKLNLELQGHRVFLARDGEEGLEMWREISPDLTVLDLMLPRRDGHSLLVEMRKNNDRAPILILSAKNEIKDKVKSFTLGVDDYLSKPFDLDEFLLRVGRLLTQSSWYQRKLEEEYIFGVNRVHFAIGKAWHGESEVKLTEHELKVLKLLIENEGRPITRSELLEKGWGYDGEIHTRTVDNFMVRFRKYFENDPKNPKHFKSLRSVGYAFYQK